MGGLVVRACIHKRRSVMDALMARDGARFVMLGTPNQGAHSMVENLLGKGDTLRTLVRLDLKHDMQEVLDIVAGFRGALQLLPKPGFMDTFQGRADGGELLRLPERADLGRASRPRCATSGSATATSARPAQAVLDAASWLWRQDGAGAPGAAAPSTRRKSIYVFGVARNTPCGVREEKAAALKMVGTTRGDGTVTWESGRIGGIGSFYYMPAEHGDLPSTDGVLPGAGRPADHRRDRAAADAAAGGPRDRAAAAGDLRRRPADRRRRRRAGARPDGRLAAQPRRRRGRSAGSRSR